MSSHVRPARPAPPRASRGEIKALTGLRAVAAMWVVLYHFKWLLWPYLDQVPFVRPVLDAGWTGVELFFVLSGFVIARSYLDECGARWRTSAVVRFLFNRFARVWPAYAVVTVVAFLWLFAITRLGWTVHIVAPHPDATVAELGRELTMTQMWGESTLLGQSFNPPGWSVSAEWLAYLAFPLLALLLRPLRRLHPVVLLVLACAAMLPLYLTSFQDGPPDVDTNWVLRIACCFVAGILACLAVRDLPETERAEQWGLFLSVTCVLGVLLVCFWASWRRAADPTVDFAGVAIALYPLLIVGLTLSRRGPARVLAKGPLLYGGRLSYCLYLVHFVVQDVLITSLWQEESKLGVLTPGLALSVPLLVLASVAASAALHHGVEEPARRALLSLYRRATTRTDEPRPRDAAQVRPPEEMAAPGSRLGELAEPWPDAAADADAILRRIALEPRTERLTTGSVAGHVPGPRHTVSAVRPDPRSPRMNPVSRERPRSTGPSTDVRETVGRHS